MEGFLYFSFINYKENEKTNTADYSLYLHLL